MSALTVDSSMFHRINEIGRIRDQRAAEYLVVVWVSDDDREVGGRAYLAEET
jgi:hypothetical protein